MDANGDLGSQEPRRAEEQARQLLKQLFSAGVPNLDGLHAAAIDDCMTVGAGVGGANATAPTLEDVARLIDLVASQDDRRIP